MRGWFVLFILACTRQLPAHGQATVNPVSYSVPGSVYTQNFDGLPVSGTFSLTGKGPFNLSAAPFSATDASGWQFFLASGTNLNAGFGVATGSSTGNAVYSLGVTSSGERALGSLSSGSGIYAFGLILTNQTGGSLNQITISFTAEQWRKGGSANRNTWSFRYKTGNISNIDQANLVDEPNLNFSSVITTTPASMLIGNLPENQQAVSHTITGVNWKPGEQLLLRWDDADEPGNDDIVALDNFSFSAALASAAPTITSVASANVNTNTAGINAVVNDNQAGTAVRVEYDTVAGFQNAQSIFPFPDSLPPGTGNSTITARLTGLRPGQTYYFRVKAENSVGATTSPPKTFATSMEAPIITNIAATSVSTNTATINANVSGEGISEKGFVWTTAASSSVTNTIITGAGSGAFSQLLTGLPQGSIVLVRPYAINAAGTTYGDTIRVVTQTTITSLMPATAVKTNAATVQFIMRTAQPLSGLSPSNFQLQTTGLTGAFVTAVVSNANGFTITVNTGSGSGTVALVLENDEGLSLPISNKPFMAPACPVDKLAPQLRLLSIPDAAMKIGDTVPVAISVAPEPDVLKMNNGNVNGFLLSPPVKRNDSLYTSYFIVTAGGKDVDAAAYIPFTITLSDPLGNAGTVTASIVQQNDPLDAGRPYILAIQPPANGFYKTGDTLAFTCTFNEKINVTNNGIPSLTLAIGTRNRTATYVEGNNSERIVLRYIIQPDDIDIDGIKTASAITLNSAAIKDFAGNNALLNFTTLQTDGILVDAVAPVVNFVQLPVNKTYRLGDTLNFYVVFSKGITITTNTDTPVIKLIIGSSEKNLVFRTQVAPNSLLFSYIIEYGDVDKNGIGIGSAIATKNKITDSIGNAANLGLKTTPLAGIKIDAVAPVFITADSENVFVCENGALTITNAFAVTDEEAGELVSWRIKNPPLSGTVSLASFNLTSTGKSIVPAGVVYRPNPGQYGTDTLVTELTDGINTTRKTIMVFIQPGLQNNIIYANQLVCEEKLPALLTGSNLVGGNAVYKYAWEYSNDSSRFSAAHGMNSDANYQPAQLRGNTWFRRRAISGACADTSAPVKITTVKNGFWTGSKNSDWNNPANWCGNAIPSSATNVMVYADALNQPQIADTAKCNDIFLGNGAHLRINGILTLSGNITAAPASVDLKYGTLVCESAAPQNIDGNHFESNELAQLVINNAAGVSMSQTVKISASLVLSGGFLETNNFLLLRNGVAIGASAAGTSIRGRITLEHLIRGRRKSYHLLGHPFNHTLGLQVLADSLDIKSENGSPQGLRDPLQNELSAFRYEFSKADDSTGVDAGWTAFTNINGTGENTWQKCEGIRIRFNGRSSAEPDSIADGDGRYQLSQMLRLEGEVNTGEQELILPGSNVNRYHVAANPYPSAIDLSRLTKSSGIQNHYWLWNPWQGNHGGYTSFPFSSANTLPAFGAFVVKTNSGNENNLLFTEHCKTRGGADTLPAFKSDDVFFVELRLATDSIFWDRLLLLQIDSARAGVDRNDAEKFLNEDVNFYSISRENRKLSIDARPVTNETVIPIGLQSAGNTQFSIRVAGAKLPGGNRLMLHDRYLDKWTPLEKDSVYHFNTTDDTLSRGDKRFEICSPKQQPDSLLINKNLAMKTYPIPAKHTIVIKYASAETGNTLIRIVDIFGNLIKSIPLGMQKQGQVIVPVANLASGIYVVELRCGNEVVMQKVIKQ